MKDEEPYGIEHLGGWIIGWCFIAVFLIWLAGNALAVYDYFMR